MPKSNKSKMPPIAAIGAVGSFHLEVDKALKGFKVVCSGVRGVTEFTGTSVKLKLCGFSLFVFGEGLHITVFEGKTIEISGKISEMRIEYAKV